MGRVIELFVDQFLAIDQTDPTTNPQGQSVFQTISFTDSAKNYRTVTEVSQTLNFGQVIGLRRSVYNLAVSDFLSFYDKGGNGPELQTITQFFHIGQVARIVEFEQLVQSIIFTQSVTVTFAKNATNTLVMTDSASCNLVRSIEVFHTFFIGSGGTGYLLKEESYSISLPTLTGPNVPEC